MIENCLKQWNREWELDFHSHFWMIIMCRTLNPKPVHGEHKGSWWTQSTLRSANNLLPGTPLGFELTTSALIPLVGPQTLPTLLKAIACKKDAYPNLIVHSPKRPRQTQRELMDVTNSPIYYHYVCIAITKKNETHHIIIWSWFKI